MQAFTDTAYCCRLAISSLQSGGLMPAINQVHVQYNKHAHQQQHKLIQYCTSYTKLKTWEWTDHSTAHDFHCYRCCCCHHITRYTYVWILADKWLNLPHHITHWHCVTKTHCLLPSSSDNAIDTNTTACVKQCQTFNAHIQWLNHLVVACLAAGCEIQGSNLTDR